MIASKTDQLIEENLGLVAMVVRRYVGHGTDYDDLFQIGSMGLVKAAKRFDEEKNLKFSTYAVAKIVGELKTYFRDNGSVKIPRSRKEQLYKIKKAQNELKQKLGREPTVSEMGEFVGICAEDVVECLEIRDSVLSLDKESEEGGSLYEMIGEDCGESNLQSIVLHEALDKLEPMERQIVMMRYFLDKTQNEIAEILNLSQVSVSRKEKIILKKLGKMIS